MRSNEDPCEFFNGLHARAATDLLRLMDGFYSNIEDGLFEMAYANDDPQFQRRTVELMRELRFRRKHLLQTFGKRVQFAATAWAQGQEIELRDNDETHQAQRMAAKCNAHFGVLLQAIAERCAHATDCNVSRTTLPFSPLQISLHFIRSCRTVDFDDKAVELVESLFQRFVLDRLGAMYGAMNQALEVHGYCTMDQLDKLLYSTGA
ncbi:MAG: DUF1631 family protein [Pseudomonadota bacterium]